ncbi:DEAD-box ATP-dependent RNA helicase 39 [Geodia barretti]|uniref:DEAD-box ATP-dependent RNA helicase 39 n=1 Tax=Geodia barretti TaxID=519541 RepID=A0AA35X6L2_GEOBA|nr:DEAD-box ATP-dependent RNA helicase 39 [Geodia barretti]
MRISWRACRPALSQALHKRASSIRLPRRVVADNRPITKVQTIIIKPTSKHPALQRQAAESFSELRLRGDVVDALGNIGLSQPTVTQMLTIPHILKGRNVLCAAETGSGKTLAYLAPVISELRREEAEEGVVPRLRRPRALVVLPSRDLASQVLAVAKSLCHVARFRAVGLIRGGKKRNIRNSLLSPVDLAVTTPDALLQFRRQEQIQLSDVRFLVVDEADTLFDRSFQEATTSIIRTIKASTTKPLSGADQQPDRGGAQVIAVAATLSTHLMESLQSLVPSVSVVTTKSLHKILPHIEQRFHKVTQTEKADKLLSIIRECPGDVFMVFCNTVSSCDWTSHFLQTNRTPVTTLHAGFRASVRFYHSLHGPNPV